MFLTIYLAGALAVYFLVRMHNSKVSKYKRLTIADTIIIGISSWVGAIAIAVAITKESKVN